jgi:hypothetical protein
MHLFLFSYHYLFMIFFFLGIFYSSLSQIRKREQQGKHHSIGVVLSLPAENTSCFCIHIHINQKICEYSRVVFFFFFLYWPNLEPTLFLYPDSSIPTYKNRVCIYIQKGIISGIYIQEHCTILYSVVYI